MLDTGLFDGSGRRIMRQERMVPNPMLKYPPRARCWCGGRSQARHCCLKKMAPTVPESLEAVGKERMATALAIYYGDKDKPETYAMVGTQFASEMDKRTPEAVQEVKA